MNDLRKCVNLSIENEEERPNKSMRITRSRSGQDQRVAVASTNITPLEPFEGMGKWEEEGIWRERRE